MIFAIMPLVKGHSSPISSRRVAAYSVGALLSGVALCAVLGFLGEESTGRLPMVWTWAVAGLVSLCLSTREIGMLSVPVPSSSWQVPRSWNVAGVSGALAYGLVLGAGVFTRAPFATFHAMLLWAYVQATPTYGVILGATYASCRVLSAVVAREATRRLKSQSTLATTTYWIQRQGGGLHVVNAIMLMAMGVSLLATL